MTEEEHKSESYFCPPNWEEIANRQLKLLELDYLRTIQASQPKQQPSQGSNQEIHHQPVSTTTHEKSQEPFDPFNLQKPSSAAESSTQEKEEAVNGEQKDGQKKDSDDSEEIQGYGYEALDCEEEEDDDHETEEKKQEISKKQEKSESKYADIDVKILPTPVKQRSMSRIIEEMQKLELKGPKWAQNLSDAELFKRLN